MKALLNSGEWVEIDTEYLSTDRYNTAIGSIYDNDIQAIKDDARINKGRCKYCGQIVKRGEEEKHFQKIESEKSCEGCFWYQKEYDKLESESTKETKLETGEIQEIITKVRFYTMQCHYNDGCTHEQCRKRGIEWFTDKNTFFLKYPNGLPELPLEKLDKGFLTNADALDAHFFEQIGSYSLAANFEYKDGKPVSVKYYTLWNCKKNINFRYINGEFVWKNCYQRDWNMNNKIDVPYAVKEKIKKICAK